MPSSRSSIPDPLVFRGCNRPTAWLIPDRSRPKSELVALPLLFHRGCGLAVEKCPVRRDGSLKLCSDQDTGLRYSRRQLVLLRQFRGRHASQKRLWDPCDRNSRSHPIHVRTESWWGLMLCWRRSCLVSPRALTCFTTASRSKPASSSSLNIASVSPKKPSMMRRTISRVNTGLEGPWAFFCRSVMSMVVAEP